MELLKKRREAKGSTAGKTKGDAEARKAAKGVNGHRNT